MIRRHSNARSRITLVMPSAELTGGAEEAFVQLLKSEPATTIDWQVIFLEDGPLVEEMRPYALESRVVACGRTREFWKWFRASGEISRLSSKFQSEMILGWMTKGHVYGGLAAWKMGVPASWFQMGLPESGLLDRVARCLPAQAVFTCSEFVAREQRKKQPRANVVAVPLGADLSRFNLDTLPSPADARMHLGLPSSGPIIGIVGRLQRWKGMHTLIKAMPAVIANHSDAHCLVVGGVYPAEPDYENELHMLADSLGISDRVTFAGAQSNVPIWMQAMDVFVHASEREPFGIVVIEALALGKPVVACTPGGPEEILSHDESIVGASFAFDDQLELHSSISSCLARKSDAVEKNTITAKNFSHARFSRTMIDRLASLPVDTVMTAELSLD